jgi:outer membrane lipoprotein-sorting protein
MAGAAGKAAALALAVAILPACAARMPARPEGPPAPAPDASAHFAAATAHCRGLRTLTAELALSGRAGDDRLRGRVISGFERGGAARLEGVAPFGAPVFILAAKGERATLLLPRERRVLDDAPVADVVERLTGLPLGADSLLDAVAGCAGESAEGGRQWPGGWEAVQTGERTVYLRQQAGAWQITGIDASGWRADYRLIVNGFPREVRLRSTDGRVDMVAAVQQLEANVQIPAAAFEVTIPPGTDPMRLEDLRTVAPLRTP